jgi:hypothetical protein
MTIYISSVEINHAKNISFSLSLRSRNDRDIGRTAYAVTTGSGKRKQGNTGILHYTPHAHMVVPTQPRNEHDQPLGTPSGRQHVSLHERTKTTDHRVLLLHNLVLVMN